MVDNNPFVGTYFLGVVVFFFLGGGGRGGTVRFPVKERTGHPRLPGFPCLWQVGCTFWPRVEASRSARSGLGGVPHPCGWYRKIQLTTSKLRNLWDSTLNRSVLLLGINRIVLPTNKSLLGINVLSCWVLLFVISTALLILKLLGLLGKMSWIHPANLVTQHHGPWKR